MAHYCDPALSQNTRRPQMRADTASNCRRSRADEATIQRNVAELFNCVQAGVRRRKRFFSFLVRNARGHAQTSPQHFWPFISPPNIPQTPFATQTFPNIFLRITEHSCTNRLHLQCVSRISVCGQVQQNKIMSNDVKTGFIAWGARGREFKSHRPDHF
jgi:hypothetical protein